MRKFVLGFVFVSTVVLVAVPVRAGAVETKAAYFEQLHKSLTVMANLDAVDEFDGALLILETMTPDQADAF